MASSKIPTTNQVMVTRSASGVKSMRLTILPARPEKLARSPPARRKRAPRTRKKVGFAKAEEPVALPEIGDEDRPKDHQSNPSGTGTDKHGFILLDKEAALATVEAVVVDSESFPDSDIQIIE